MADTYELIDGKPTIKKDPDAVLDYSIDLTAWLALTVGDTLASVVVTNSPGLTKLSQATAGALATAWFLGGVRGATEWATYRFTTAQGRVDDRTIYFLIGDR